MYARKKFITIGMKLYIKKVANGFRTFPRTAMIRFCGLPTGVRVLPIVTEKATVSNISFALFCGFSKG